jgi:predicted phage terminase large subunit-like protein
VNEYNIAEQILCQRSLFEFLQSQYREYSWNWHHILIADKIQQVIEGKIKRLMLFVPPQHQKSTIASRAGIAWAFGKNPDFRIVHCAYGSDLVEGFSRDVQRIIDNEFYNSVFPNTYLGASNVRTDAKKGYVRTVERFEIVGAKGSYFCAGVGGGITGKSCDIGVIDDPIKGASSANSKTIRDGIWEWYLQDFLTRLHNDSRQIIIQTRWHHDDLAGRLLKKEADKWHIVNIPAIKEDNSNEYDHRAIGEALYPQMHSLERLLEVKERSPRTFAALYQQRPTVEGGNIVKSDWFKIIDKAPKTSSINFFVDTAYTENKTNDPTGIIATSYHNGTIYIHKAEKFYLEFPKLVDKLQAWTKENSYGNASTIRIEPKASGLSVIQYLKTKTNLNVVNTQTPKDSKETRLNVASNSIESGRVVLELGAWNNEFIDELCLFPQAEHDEYVDLICYAIDYYTKSNTSIIW